MKLGMKTVALLVSIGACNMASAASYTITDLGTLGGRNSQGYALNNAGQVTGFSSDASGASRAFLYSDGTMNDLGTLGGARSFGLGINNAGQVTGGADDASGNQRAFIYRDGIMTDLGTLGGEESAGLGINDAGQVTGRAETASDANAEHAFLYRDGIMSDLGTLGGRVSWGFDINNAGQVTGLAQNGDFDERAFLYSGGIMSDLFDQTGRGKLGERTASRTGINDAGQVTGTFFLNNAEARAFLSHFGSVSDLGPGRGLGINNAGHVVGESGGAAALFSNGTVTDLNTLIPPEMRWLLMEARGINDAGQITGSGRIDINNNGIDDTDPAHAFLLTPVPVPAAVWLLGSGLLGLAGMSVARRRARVSAADGETVVA